MAICSQRGCSNETEGRWKQCPSCRERKKLYAAQWREKNPQNLQYMRDWNRARRECVLAHYGGKCFCCGEDRFEFLCIDHINGGGERHRSEVGQGSRMIGWIIDNNFPDLFQISCHNCNQARGYYGYCPHEQ